MGQTNSAAVSLPVPAGPAQIGVAQTGVVGTGAAGVGAAQTVLAPAGGRAAGETVFAILIAISFSHFLNDMIQSLLPALYPMFKANYALSFAQIGLIALAFQCTASVLQPLVGLFTDRRPLPFSLPLGMGLTLTGLLLLAHAGSFPALVLAASMVGMGSSVFHPESSRVARLASGGRHSLAQSVFQVGGNLGTASGPLLAAYLVLPNGQGSVAWFSFAALLAILVLGGVGFWYRRHRRAARAATAGPGRHPALTAAQVRRSLAVLFALMFSKFFYLASIGSYFTFFLIERFHLPVATAQVHLFVFLAAVAAGTIVGGPLGDRIGRKYVIWVSILGVLPFTLLLPYADLGWTTALSVVIGLLLAAAFPSIVVYAQELMPGKVGMTAGLFFGLAFGMGGLGAAGLGWLADATSIATVYRLCAFLPAIGLLAALLPDLDRLKAA